MNLRRTLSKAFAALLAASLLAGCGGGNSAPAADKGDLVFWHWWTDRQPVLERLAAEYKAKTGVGIQFQVAAPVGFDYNNKLQASAQADTLPDIVGLAAGGEFLARYIQAGKIVELTDAMKAGWDKRFFPRALEAFTYKAGNQYGVKDDSVWGVPISAMAIRIFYNKDLVKQAGLNPDKPFTTWKEFLAAGKKMKEKNIIPMSVGFGDLWMIGAFLEPYAWAYLGTDKMRDTLLGKYPYSSPEWEKALSLFIDLRDNDMLVKGCVTLPNKESEQLFSSGRVAMAMNGSWGVNVYKGMNPNLNYGVTALPVPQDAKFPLYVRGGVGSGAAVTSRDEARKKKAIDFLMWLTDKEQQTVYANEGLDLPANRECAKGLLPVLQPFSDAMEHLIPDIQLSEKYEVQEVLWKGVQSVFIGERTPAQVLDDVQKAKAKSLQKN
jgi:ABC-type glycerol-3-phosphate transport system substrate-binding protein